MITKIPINQGVFKAQNPESLENNGFAEKLINFFIDQVGNNYDRPRLKSSTALTSPDIIGTYWFNGLWIFVTQDRKVWSYNKSGNILTDITGTLLAGDARPVFETDGTTLFIIGGDVPLKWTGTGVTQALGGSPPKGTHLIYLDGYLITNKRDPVEKNKTIHFADFELPESWFGLNVFSAVADSDEVQGVTSSFRELYVVGEKTTEIWQNVGSDPVPFARAHVWSYGTPAKYSIHSTENSVFFLDQTRRIIQISGREIVRLSEGIEEDLDTYSVIEDCWASSFIWNGSTHVVFVFPTEEKTWSIDLRNKQWTEWNGYDNDYARARVNSMYWCFKESTGLVGDFGTGNVWELSENENTDAGGVFKRLRRFSEWNGGASLQKNTRLMRIKMRRDISKLPVGTEPILEVRWKDDGKDWSEFRQIPLGEIGEKRKYIEIYRLGIYRTRQYELQFSDPAILNITGVEVDEEVMTE